MTFIVLLLIGILFSIIGVYLVRRKNKFVKKGRKSKARVVKYIKEKTTNRNDNTIDTYYYPVLEFKNEDGQVIRKTHDSGTSNKPKDSNKHIDIFYLRNNQNEYEILIDKAFWTIIFPYSILIIGLLFIIGSFWSLILKN
jgi:hypothetical protein